MTAAPTAYSRVSAPPVCGFTEFVRLASSTPPTAASVEHIMKQEMRTQATLIPARRAASALPPTAYTWRPHAVRVSRKVRTTSSAPTMGTTIGTPLSEARNTLRLRSLERYQVAASSMIANAADLNAHTTIGGVGRPAPARDS